MTVFSMSLASSGPSSRGFPFHGGNATESAIDYTKNDLILGSQDPFFWFLVPVFGVVGVGACVVVNYTTLLLVQFLRLLQAAVVSAPTLLRGKQKR